MTIEKNSILGIIEKLKDEDQVGELQINEMTVNLEQKVLTPAAKITEKKKKYILDNVKFARNKELIEALKKNISLLYWNFKKPSVTVSSTLAKARLWLRIFNSRSRTRST
jgi:hypothetical protein